MKKSEIIMVGIMIAALGVVVALVLHVQRKPISDADTNTQHVITNIAVRTNSEPATAVLSAIADYADQPADAIAHLCELVRLKPTEENFRALAAEGNRVGNIQAIREAMRGLASLDPDSEPDFLTILAKAEHKHGDAATATTCTELLQHELATEAQRFTAARLLSDLGSSRAAEQAFQQLAHSNEIEMQQAAQIELLRIATHNRTLSSAEQAQLQEIERTAASRSVAIAAAALLEGENHE